MTKTSNIAILFSGNGSNLENIVKQLYGKKINDMRINIPIAISSRKDAYGIKRCANLGLKCEIIASSDFKNKASDYDKTLISILQSHNIHLVVLAGFMRILGEDFCNTFKTINIHPSILPLFKGANAIVESYHSDMKIAGVSVHWVTNKLDSGPLIAQDIIHKIDDESLESFESRIHELEYKIYPKAILEALCKI